MNFKAEWVVCAYVHAHILIDTIMLPSMISKASNVCNIIYYLCPIILTCCIYTSLVAESTETCTYIYTYTGIYTQLHDQELVKKLRRDVCRGARLAAVRF